MLHMHPRPYSRPWMSFVVVVVVDDDVYYNLNKLVVGGRGHLVVNSCPAAAGDLHKQGRNRIRIIIIVVVIIIINFNGRRRRPSLLGRSQPGAVLDSPRTVLQGPTDGGAQMGQERFQCIRLLIPVRDGNGGRIVVRGNVGKPLFTKGTGIFAFCVCVCASMGEWVR